jgi:hypothetical protein
VADAAGGDSVSNSTTENNGVQAGEVHGGIHFHSPNPPPQRRVVALLSATILAVGVTLGVLLSARPGPAGTGASTPSGQALPDPSSTLGQPPAATGWPTSNTELMHACKLLDMESVAAYLGITVDQMQYENNDTIPDSQPDREKIMSHTACAWKIADKSDGRVLTAQFTAYPDDSVATEALDSMVAKMKQNDAADYPNVADQAVFAPSGTWLLARKSNRVLAVTFRPPTGRHTGDFATLAVTAASRAFAF